MQEQDEEKAAKILKAMERASEDQRKVLDRYEAASAIGKEFAKVVDGAQDPNKIYWKG